MAISKSVEETEQIAGEIAKKVKNGGLVCMFGDLGTGKTTFTKGLAKELGIEKFSVKSPTYTYMRQYIINDRAFFHIDLYRIEELDELLEAEMKEIIENKENIIIIEWAEKMKSILPTKRIDIKLKYISKDEREINVLDKTIDIL
jgi:tRNA threonylcarbamoyladenosine biosynthesis protein TsaE